MIKFKSILMIAVLAMTQSAFASVPTIASQAKPELKLALHHTGYPHRSRTHRDVRYPHHQHDHRYHWVHVRAGAIPLHALVISKPGETLTYHCRVKYKGSRIIGTVQVGRPCIIRVNGHLLSVDKYKIMTR